MRKTTKTTFDKRKTIAEILLSSKSVEEVKMKFDLNGVNYDRENEYNFLHYIVGFRSSNGYRVRDSKYVPLTKYLNTSIIRDIRDSIRKDPTKYMDEEKIVRKILHRTVDNRTEGNYLDYWIQYEWAKLKLRDVKNKVGSVL